MVKKNKYRFFVVRLKKKTLMLLVLIFFVSICFVANKTYLSVFNSSSSYTHIVVIDAGHGGIDCGTHDGQGLLEKNINLDVALMTRDILESKGIKVVMTRTGDGLPNGGKLSLDSRVSIINKSKASIFVSIHVNAFEEDPSVRGIVTFYHPSSKEGKLLAEKINASVNDIVYGKLLKTNSLKAKTNSDDYIILRESRIPGVIFEMGFITNSKDRDLLKRKDYKKNVAMSISEGIIRYLRGS